MWGASAGISILKPDSNPDIDWMSVARGLGVPSVRVETAEALTRELERLLAMLGPTLIEMIL